MKLSKEQIKKLAEKQNEEYEKNNVINNTDIKRLREVTLECVKDVKNGLSKEELDKKYELFRQEKPFLYKNILEHGDKNLPIFLQMFDRMNEYQKGKTFSEINSKMGKILKDFIDKK